MLFLSTPGRCKDTFRISRVGDGVARELRGKEGTSCEVFPVGLLKDDLNPVVNGGSDKRSVWGLTML